MCLAVIGKVLRVDKPNAISDVEGNLVNINIQLTPDVCEGQHVLIHAGFSIATMPEDEVLMTQRLLSEVARIVDHVKQ